ncbi:MAG TPA: acetyl-CoA carboxylase, carboxyltransferase subunit beta [Oligoflexia bacterium]|nr:acetyl-CoA carboxylase, carboxyltransferase subunit beta [Oligoflexia bacterium]HMP49161.1 acetyl-CoA carboxylase, carboxyltransferase subunit beta [Oligoflexia bacterium]
MCAWFSRSKAPKPIEDSDRLEIPGGLWVKCKGCGEIIYNRELERNLFVCPKCGYHFRLSAEQRIQLLCDREGFDEFDAHLRPSDPLNFKDEVRYKDRIKKVEKTGKTEAVITGYARINGIRTTLGVFNFGYMGGSMGAVVGEKLTRMIERAIQEDLPVIIVSASGGARMQEGIYSLMQMAKITSALYRLSEKRLPYLSLMTDPTTGGVAASFAMQGDLNLAEPGALIGFAGPRVIEQTIRSKLPEGFQRSEFLFEHGMLDMVIERHALKERIAQVLGFLIKQ